MVLEKDEDEVVFKAEQNAARRDVMAVESELRAALQTGMG